MKQEYIDPVGFMRGEEMHNELSSDKAKNMKQSISSCDSFK